VFDVSDNTATVSDSARLVADLNIETTPIFKATVGTTGIVGETTDQFQAITPYVPHHNRHFVLYAHRLVGGGLVDVFQQRGYILDLSGTFADVVGQPRITGTPTTITGLSSVTEYYFKITPKYDAFNGTDSSRSHDHVLHAHANRAHLNPVKHDAEIMAWDGSFTGVAVKYTTNVFDTSGAVFTTPRSRPKPPIR
jgi:hypothetical protein